MIDYSGFLKDWELELQADDCPFALDTWAGILAANLFCAAMLVEAVPPPFT